MRRLLLCNLIALAASALQVSLCAGQSGVYQGDVQALDLDAWLQGQSGRQGDPRWQGDASWQITDPYEHCGCQPAQGAPWSWQVLPEGLLYPSYLGGVREPRLGVVLQHDRRLGWTADATLGGRVGLVRYGSVGGRCAEGFQIDIEGAAMLRLDEDRELVSTDYRAGVPLTYAVGRYQTKLAYYHVSSHLGDEFLLKTGAMRINFVRDVIVWGHAFQWTPALRAYFEAGFAFYNNGGSQPWEFQFGLDFSPPHHNGARGSPFFTINGHLREEVNFGGNFVAQGGWQWRSRHCDRLLRTGVQYYNGKSPQFEFFDDFEQQIGFGVWYDF